jgi:uncharacterized protein (TIGR03086 family)
MTPVTGVMGADLLQQAARLVDELVADLDDPQWSYATPCPEWTVRDLVNHLTVENLWAAELFAGATIDQVGHRFDGDQLGATPLRAWRTARNAARAAASSAGAAARVVHLSFGDVPGQEYAMQLFADHLLHAWDLARAIDRTITLPADQVQECLAWFAPNEDAYRSAGLIGPRATVSADAPADHHLLAAFGRLP